jgi:hypothetical protein
MARSFKALNVIDYVSIRTGHEVRVNPGDVFSDMNSVGVRNELDHGNIVEVIEGGEKK